MFDATWQLSFTTLEQRQTSMVNEKNEVSLSLNHIIVE